MHDQTLLTQWHRNRDGEAFHELTRKYASMTYATALRILRNPHDAEDVAQLRLEYLYTNLDDAYIVHEAPKNFAGNLGQQGSRRLRV